MTTPEDAHMMGPHHPLWDRFITHLSADDLMYPIPQGEGLLCIKCPQDPCMPLAEDILLRLGVLEVAPSLANLQRLGCRCDCDILNLDLWAQQVKDLVDTVLIRALNELDKRHIKLDINASINIPQSVTNFPRPITHKVYSRGVN